MILDWIRRKLKPTPKATPTEVVVDNIEPFIRMRCSECGADVTWDDVVVAGTAAVVECVCKTKWAAIAPSIQILPAEQLAPLVKAYEAVH